MLKHIKEYFAPSVCVSMEAWCGLEVEENGRNCGGVAECLEEPEEED